MSDWLASILQYSAGLASSGVSGPALENEATVAIAAIDKAMLVYFEIDLGMAQCGWTKILAASNGARAIAAHAPAFDKDGFGHKIAHITRR